ncbi:MAG: type II toxin-antitoxin system RelB/DinJ family antitoxin [Aquificales bacterium]|nr:type II toxin-antitoxin system RelB/DinJ family antitoxin [Aquificales bacterium]
MSKVQANYRIDAHAKQKAYAVLSHMGIKPTDAVNMLMHHIAMFGELPFHPRVPNTETIEAMKELENGGGKAYATSQEMYDDLGI